MISSNLFSRRTASDLSKRPCLPTYDDQWSNKMQSGMLKDALDPIRGIKSVKMIAYHERGASPSLKIDTIDFAAAA